MLHMHGSLTCSFRHVHWNDESSESKRKTLSSLVLQKNDPMPRHFLTWLLSSLSCGADSTESSKRNTFQSSTAVACLNTPRTEFFIHRLALQIRLGEVRAPANHQAPQHPHLAAIQRVHESGEGVSEVFAACWLLCRPARRLPHPRPQFDFKFEIEFEQYSCALT